METLDFFLQALFFLWMNHVQKMNRPEFVDLEFSYNVYSLHTSVGRVSMIASPSEKEVQSFHEVQSSLGL
jgi:hypothetical protein